LSIRNRLIISNIAMIVIPVITFFLIDILLGIFLFRRLDGNSLETFIKIRFGLVLLVIIITNGLLAFFVSKSIILPVKKLTKAATEIHEGNLDFHIKPLNNDELGQLAETFEKMRFKLKESAGLQVKYEENRKELIANISHDLKTPITSIKGYVEGICDGVANTPEKMDRYIRTIYSKAIDLDHLIDELFLYSKLDLNRVPFHFEIIDLYMYIADFIEELRFELEEEGISVTFQADQKDSYKVMADREQLKRVVTNIIHNSLKHLDKKEKNIYVHMNAMSEKVIVQMEDNGSGISEKELPNIFDRFYRVDTSRNTATGGSGLGLAIVKRIIQEHDGEIWAESTLGEGTSIIFTLKKAGE
jgi:signal transduction histidine kinase